MTYLVTIETDCRQTLPKCAHARDERKALKAVDGDKKNSCEKIGKKLRPYEGRASTPLPPYVQRLSCSFTENEKIHFSLILLPVVSKYD